MVDTSKSFDENFQQYYGESFSLTSQQFNEKNALDTLTTKPFIDKLNPLLKRDEQLSECLVQYLIYELGLNLKEEVKE